LGLSVECVLRYKSFPRAADLWSLLATTHPERAGDMVDIGGDEIRLEDVHAEFLGTEGDDFSVEFAGGEIFFAQVANHKLARLELSNVVTSVADADSWLSALLVDPNFVQARLYDHDYSYWQNATDPIQYEGSGRSMAGLPMISNGLSYPMNQDIVDISGNPGRSVLRMGYIESVGAVMWLGEGLWKTLGRPTPEWKRIASLQVAGRPGVTRVQAASQPFTSSSGAEAELQLALRQLIFGA